MEKYQILIVEDESDVNHLLASILEPYAVTSAYSGTEAKLLLGQRDFDLILLDLMLPGMTGEELIAWMRGEGRQIPVIVLSAKQEVSDRVNVLRLGADDYIMKPFEIDEVLARVEAVLRRCHGQPKQTQFESGEGEKSLVIGDLVLNREQRTVRAGGVPVALTVREFEILALLMSYPKKVFTRENLFTAIWGEEYFGEDNTVNVHISNLRAKLAKAAPGREYVKTVWGIGFKMNLQEVK